MTEEELLRCKAPSSIRQGWPCQLKSMQFFQDVSLVSKQTLDNMRQKDVLTNLGSESKMAELGYRLKVCGGTTSLKAISDRAKISSNKLFVQESWRSLSDKERRSQWYSQSGNSPEAKRVVRTDKDYVERVNLKQETAVALKMLKKQNINKRNLKLLQAYKKHELSSSYADMQMLNQLKTDQLLVEIRYLRTTIPPNIKEKRRIKTDDKIYFEKFSDIELRQQIKYVLRPTNNMDQDRDQIDQALKKVSILG